jgi:hypothetical protein
MLGVNISGHERKNKLSSFRDGQYPINFEGYLTVRLHLGEGVLKKILDWTGRW